MNYQLYHVADSFDLIRRMSKPEFDVTITDPPYEEHCQDNQMSARSRL